MITVYNIFTVYIYVYDPCGLTSISVVIGPKQAAARVDPSSFLNNEWKAKQQSAAIK